MAFVEIRRFYERNEAFIAKAALESAGLGAMVRDNGYASMYFGVSIAAGGYGLFVLDDDVADAREILLAATPIDPASLKWTNHPKSLTSLPLTAVATLGGILMGAPPLIEPGRRMTFIGVVGALVALTLVVALTATLFEAI